VERFAERALYFVILLISVAAPASVRATRSDAADGSVQRFLARDESRPAYRAERWLEAETGGRHGWIKAVTSYSERMGFLYDITAEGGSGFIRARILRALLDGERDAIQRGDPSRASLDMSNYTFCENGVDADGLANVSVTPRRKERFLVSGTIFLRAADGDLVRLQGRLAKSPSFWLKHVDIVRQYDRIGGTVVPIALESVAQLRPGGAATLKMIYTYLEINGRPVAP
jgi:hypothetical protein